MIFVRSAAGVHGVPRIPPFGTPGSIPANAITPGLNGQELMTVGGVATWVFDPDDVRVVASSADLAPLTGTDGDLVFVQSRKMFVRFALAQALATGVTVFAGTGGQWNRVPVADTTWALQATWWLDAVGGSDDNTGLTNVTALKSWAELFQRLDASVQSSELQQTVTITLLSSLAEGISLTQAISAAVPTARVILTSDPSARTTLFNGNQGFSAVTAISRAAGGGNMLTVTDNHVYVGPALDFGTLLKARIRLTTGANAGAMGWINGAPAANQATLDPICTAIDPTVYTGSVPVAVNPAIGDHWVAESLPSVWSRNINIQSDSPTVTYIEDSIQVGPGQDGTGNTSINSIESQAIVFSIQSAQVCVRTLANTNTFVNCHFSNHAASCIQQVAGLFAGGASDCAAFVPLFSTDASNGCQIRTDFTLNGVPLNVNAGILVATSCGIFNSPLDALFMTGGTSTHRELYIASNSTVYGNGNTGFGANLAAGNWIRYENTRPTVTGGSGDVNLDGQTLAWAQIPITDPFRLSGIVSSAAGRGSVYTTGILAAIGATNIFTSTPTAGMYALDIILMVTTAGAAGDTATLTIGWTDDAQAETLAVFSVVPINVKGQFQTRIVVATTGAANVTYALSFPTKTGAPAVALRISTTQLQSPGV